MLQIFGWTFVNLVSMKRGEPFSSGNKSGAAFIKLLIVTPVVFMASGICALRSVYDMNGYCTTPVLQLDPIPAVDLEPVREERILQQQSVDDTFFAFFESVSRANYMYE